jgi:phosphatidylserine/phosphatidylglycerophosphate/cardiolipin synthase-like enzyme
MAEVPEEVASSLCDRLKAVAPSVLADLRPIHLGPVPYPQAAEIFCVAARECVRSGLASQPGHLASWLASLAATAERQRSSESLELVWTGPVPEGAMLRRTDQALQEVICAARRRLLIVSFAVFRVTHIAKALKDAVARGVDVTVVLEDQKQTVPASAMMKEFEGNEGIRFLVWPESKRVPGPSGQRGAMHVKCALADEDVLFLSSANLTEFALTINMEMGLMVTGGEIPGVVARHFGALCSEGVLVPVPSLGTAGPLSVQKRVST